MSKKQKIIITISFLLLVFPFVTSAGCFGPYLIIDNNINLDCFNIESSSCHESMSIYNNCKESFLYFLTPQTDSIANKNNDNDFLSVAEELIHDDYVEIPSNWGLIFDYNNQSAELCKFDNDKPKSTKPSCLLISSAINLDNFLMKFESNSRRYTVKGHFKGSGEVINNKTDPPFVVLIVSIFLFLFFTAVLIAQKPKRKK